MAIAEEITPGQMVYAGSDAEKRVAQVRDRIKLETDAGVVVDGYIDELNGETDSQFREQKGKERWEMVRILEARSNLPIPKYGSHERDVLDGIYMRLIDEKEEPVIAKGVRAVEKVKGIKGLSQEGRVKLGSRIMKSLGLYISDFRSIESLD